MIKIYGELHSRALRALWTLEETGAAYEFCRVNLAESEQRSEWFRKINPCGKVPALTDGDLTIFESAAICEYIAKKHPASSLIPDTGTHQHALHSQWMYYTVTELEQPLWLISKHKFALPMEYRLENVATTAVYEFDKAAKIMADALKEGPWLLGRQFTLADIMAGQTILWALKYEVPVNYPALTSYVERLKKRPAFQNVMEKHRRR